MHVVVRLTCPRSPPLLKHRYGAQVAVLPLAAADHLPLRKQRQAAVADAGDSIGILGR
jgi:hypothetical protein